MTKNYALLSDVQVADQLMTWAGRVAAGEARLIELIGEFDRRGAWGGVGMLSCAHWLSLRAGMGLKTAHERVRVARALPELPVTAAAFSAGRLSWTQVRAITRVADSSDEETYVGLARHATGAQLERLVRGVRRARRITEDEADPQAAAYRMRTRVSYDADGTMVLSIRLPAEDGAVVLAALEQARAEVDLQRRQSSSGASPTKPAESSAEDSAPAPASMSDGLMHALRSYLQASAKARPELARRHRSRLVAHVDPVSGWARLYDGELLPPTSTTTLSWPAPSRLRPLTDADLTAADLGRQSREPSLALRELLGAVDGERCRFPGCTRHRRLHAHHVVYWSAGGRTDLANLVLVCSRHHTLIHRQGFQFTLRDKRFLDIATADGTPILHHPALPAEPAEDLDPDQTITATTLPPHVTGQKLELGYAVAVMMQQAA